MGEPGSFRLEVVQSSVRNMTLLAAINSHPEKEIAYDRFGMKWCLVEMRSRWKNSWFGTLLTRTTFNPLVEVQVSWSKPEPYRLEELKESYVHALDQGGQALTQSVDTGKLKTRIAEAQSFDDLIEVHRSTTTSHAIKDQRKRA